MPELRGVRLERQDAGEDAQGRSIGGLQRRISEHTAIECDRHIICVYVDHMVICVLNTIRPHQTYVFRLLWTFVLHQSCGTTVASAQKQSKTFHCDLTLQS